MNKELNALFRKIARLEGKTSQVSIGNIREIWKVIVRSEADAIRDGTTPPSRILLSAALAEVLKDKK